MRATMSWDAVAAIAELVGALGVIASLIYLSVGIRQNTRASRAATFHAATSELNQIYQAMARDPELARILRMGLQEPQTLDPDEIARFLAFSSAEFKGYENMFVQLQQGTIDQQTWNAWCSSLSNFLALPGAAHFWAARGSVFRQDFQELVERLAPSGFPAPGSANPFSAA
jgi:hypothetical protein